MITTTEVLCKIVCLLIPALAGDTARIAHTPRRRVGKNLFCENIIRKEFAYES